VKIQTTFRLVILFIVIIAGLFIFLLRTVNHPDFELPNHARIRNAAAIGAALSKYQFDHNGHLPNQLFELVPQYVDATKVRYLFPPGFDNIGGSDLSISTNLASKIRENGAYS
jgi:hypothetical protein